MRWDVLLERKTLNRINPEITRKKLKQIASVGCRNQQYGFRSRLVDIGEPELISEYGETKYRYSAKIRLDAQCRTEDVAQRRYEKIKENIARAAEHQGWQIVGEKVATAAATNGNRISHLLNLCGEDGETPPPEAKPSFIVPELTDDVLDREFAEIWERSAHIRLIHSSVERFMASGKTQASHCLLYGPPAAAKTSLFHCFKRWYEKDGFERVAFLDAPTMSKAGFETWLLNKAKSNELPEILAIEEVEKIQPENLLCLLSVMASGYIQRTNARIGKVDAKMPLLIWATCNDDEALMNFKKGAIWSRFTHTIPCSRPSRELMYRILLREAKKIPGGRQEWADAALKFGWDVLGLRDPRKLTGLLDGGNRLLDNSYQEDILSIMKAFEKEKEV